MGTDYSRPTYRHYTVHRPSTTLYYPADTLDICQPTHCFCNLPGGHRTPRYVYKEYYGDPYGHRNFRCRDPMEYLDRMMDGRGDYGGGPMGFDMLRWKDPGSWTTRDFERLGDVMDEYMARRRGRQGSGDGGGNGHGGGGGGGYGGGRNGLEGLLGGGGNNNQGRGMDDLLRLRLLNMEQLSRDLGYRVYGLEDLLLGTEHERRTGQFQQHMGRVFGPGRGYDGGGDGGGLYGQPFGLQRDRLRDAVGRGRYGPWDGYY